MEWTNRVGFILSPDDGRGVGFRNVIFLKENEKMESAQDVLLGNTARHKPLPFHKCIAVL
jgi:hypothetical protein